MMLDIKVFGYELARRTAEALPIRTDVAAQYVGLKSKPSTQSDLESDWAAYWSSQLKAPVAFDGRLWELCYVLQAIHENGHIRSGSRGLGFGCEREPLPGYLATADVNVTVADLRHGDVNGVAENQKNYDFCWSIRAMEQLGSIENGLDFVEDSLIALRPGGLAVHTTEFNFSDDSKTIDNQAIVLFQRKHFEELAKRLRASGHVVAEMDFNVDRKPLDRFIDLPPSATKGTSIGLSEIF